ncbi:MAG: PAS domain-containing protein [Microscillaceae bacterium]|nr:PAS domain-containing protein [Microscillaceae bacterium]
MSSASHRSWWQALDQPEQKQLQRKLPLLAATPETKVPFSFHLWQNDEQKSFSGELWAGPAQNTWQWLGLLQSKLPTTHLTLSKNTLSPEEGLPVREGYLILNKDENIEAISPGYQPTQSPQKQNLVGKSLDFLFPSDLGAILAEKICHLRHLQQTLYFEYYASPQQQWFQIMLILMPGQRINVCFQDISAQKQQKARLKTLTQRLKAIYESASEANIFLDTELKILACSAQALVMGKYLTGKTLRIGESLLQHIPGARQKGIQAMVEVAFAGKKARTEAQMPLWEGGHRWVHLEIAPVFDISGEVIGLSLCMRDIEAQKNAETQLAQQKEILQEIAQIHSHLIRRPVATMLGLCDLFDLENPHEPFNRDILKKLQVCLQELDQIIHRVVRRADTHTALPPTLF